MIGRDTRFINNRKQDKIRLSSVQPSVTSMREGEELLYNHPNGMLVRYRKQNGRLWSSNMTSNGDMFVDKKLTVDSLEYKKSFVDYQIFKHVFTDDIGTTEYYIPWTYIIESSTNDIDYSMYAYLTPFKMTVRKIVFRAENINSASADITLSIKSQASGSNTINTVASGRYSTDDLAADTTFTIDENAFDLSPTVNAGDKVALTIQAGADPQGSSGDWWITTVWRTYIEI